MNNKLNNMLNDFFKNIEEGLSEEEINKKLQEFIMKYNCDEIEYENTPLDDAYELLEQAEEAKSKTKAIKLAKEAYELCPACFDAILFLVELEDSCLKREKLLNEGLEKEQERLKKEGYFAKDNIGHFYGVFETRPYIRGLYIKSHMLAFEGKYKQAQEVCKEILKLNKNDNTGVRYLLMAIYAILEEEKDMLNLYKKYPEENLEMLFPLFALYYKQGNAEKAKEYLIRINKANSNFIKAFKGNIKINKDILEGYYQKGHSSEIAMYFIEYDFLLQTMPAINEFVLENSKKK